MNLRMIMIGGVSIVLGLCLMLAGVKATSGQDGNAKDEGTSKAALERQLSAARKARVESARAALAAVEAAIQAHNADVRSLVDVTRNLVEAEVDAATKPEEEIAAWTRYVEVTKAAEDSAQHLYKLGTRGGEPVTYYTAKQERERAEIALLKARIKAMK
jgi:hypothetical protein